MKDEVLSVLELVLLDIVLDFGLDALLAFHPSQGGTPDFVPFLPLIAAQDELCYHPKLLLLSPSLSLVANQIHLAFQVLHQQAELQCFLFNFLLK